LYKTTGIAGTLYILSPIDIIPDVIPFIGWVDDILVFFNVILPVIVTIMRGR